MIRELIAQATKVRALAYAPYSQFKVGAAIRLRSGLVVSGTNVENASYGLTICAERHAIAAAVLAGVAPGDIEAMAIVADAVEPVLPCGACRQVIGEFASGDTQIIVHNLRDGSHCTFCFSELLPHAFGAHQLP